MAENRKLYHHRFMDKDEEKYDSYVGDESSNEDIDNVDDVSQQHYKMDASPRYDGTSDSDTSHNKYFDKNERRRRRLKNSERNIYGVFADSDDDESYNKKRKRRDNTTPASKNRRNATAPMFVKSQTTSTTTDDTKNNNIYNKKSTNDSNVEYSSLNLQNTKIDEEELKRQNEANQKFLNLLNTGMQKRPLKSRPQFAQAEDSNSKQEDNNNYTETVQPSFGLGFAKQQRHDDMDTVQPSFGLGFSKQQRYDDPETSESKSIGLGFSKQQRQEDTDTRQAATFGLGFAKQHRQDDPETSQSTSFGLGFSKQQRHEDPETTQPMSFELGFSKQQRHDDKETMQPSSFGLGFSTQQKGQEASQSSSYGLGFPKQQISENSDLNNNILSSLPEQFGMKKVSTKPPPRKDLNLGKWEKHTKGIGMKLLSKMGFQGSGGIGKRQEIQTLVNDRPIEVKVRPANLGLGFGNFKESTSIKPETKKKDKSSKSNFSNRDSQSNIAISAIPSNAELLEEKPWRKGSKKSDQPKTKRIIIGYKELLEQQQKRESESSSMKIIDMRGPTSSATTEAFDGGNPDKTIPVGQELLHNVSILLSTYETKLLLASQYASSTEQKVIRLQSDLDGIERRKQQIIDQMDKLRRIQENLTEMEMMITDVDIKSEASDSLVFDFIKKLQETAMYYSIDEQKASEFSTTIVPALLDPIMKKWLDTWNPLKDDLSTSLKTARFVLLLRDDLDMGFKTFMMNKGSIDFSKLRITLLIQYLIPRIVNALESSRWDPVKDTEIGIRLFESLYEMIQTEISKLESRNKTEDKSDQSFAVLGSLEQDENEPNRLLNIFRKEVVHKVVYKKLMTFVTTWKPYLASPADTGTQLGRIIGDSIDAWVIPWIPHLADDRTLTTQLVAECKRKVKISLQYLYKSIPNERRNHSEFLRGAILLLQPWRGIFKQESLYDMVSETVTDRLARYISSLVSTKSIFREETNTYKWSDLDILYQYHSRRLLSNLEFLSIVEAEILTQWTVVVCQHLLDNSSNPKVFVEIARVYSDWKKHIMEAKPTEGDFSNGLVIADDFSSSTLLLQQDTRICACFYSVALIMQSAKAEAQKAFDSRIPSGNVTFRVIIAVRKKLAAQQAENDLIRMTALGGVHDNLLRAGEIAARIRLSQNGTRSSTSIPTFREVVAEFAREKDILFQPRLGANSTKDGKQIFLFGSVPVYLDDDVVFALQNGQWEGTSLETLADIESKKKLET